MRKAPCILSLIAGLFSVSINLMAQNTVDKPFEVNISAGGPHHMLGTRGQPRTTFSAMAEIKYTPNKWVSIGLLGGLHDSSRSTSLGPVQEGEPEPKTTYHCNLMLMIYGNWFSKNNLRLYSSVGYGTMGGGYVKGDGHPAHGFQFTPIGVSYGNRVFGFAELGIGWMFFPARTGIGVRF